MTPLSISSPKQYLETVSKDASLELNAKAGIDGQTHYRNFQTS
ncbi:MAG: hypothetical protein V3V81_00535 [Candidatus Bathyarchaeia archaeon]